MINTAIFDMDGTLLNTEVIWHEAWKLVNQKMSLGLSDQTLKSFIGMPKQTFDRLIPALFPSDCDWEMLRRIRLAYYKEYCETKGILVKPGVEHLLLYLKQRGYLLAVCTSTFESQSIPLLKNSGLYDYFDLIVSGDGIIYGKPNPEIYLKTLALLEKKPSECIAFEDSSFGVMSASQAGIKTFFIKDINEPTPQAQRYMFKRLQRIDEVIEELGG